MEGGKRGAYRDFLARGYFADVLAERTEEVGDCLEWTGGFGTGSTASVPLLRLHSVHLIVPRLVWMAAHGDIPAGRIVYRHHCCNDRCVLLGHLKLGRRGDHLRRRAALGLAKHMQSTRVALTQAARNRSTTKYSVEQAAAVRDLAAAGVPDILIAGATDVAVGMVGDIRLGRAWADRAPAASVFGWRP